MLELASRSEQRESSSIRIPANRIWATKGREDAMQELASDRVPRFISPGLEALKHLGTSKPQLVAFEQAYA